MAGTSMNDIKARMKSVRGTMQITKAMELVATSKLRRARERVEQTRPYCQVLREAMQTVCEGCTAADTPFLRQEGAERTCYIVVAGDRGLAGGFNSNLFRLVEAERQADGGAAVLLPIGKKAREHYQRRTVPLFTPTHTVADVSDLDVGDAMHLAEAVTEAYLRGEFDRVVLVYTRFVSMLTETPVTEQLLPLTPPAQQGTSCHEPMTEEEPQELLASIVPHYIGGMLYTAITESLAAESAARRNAMSAANKNASEMIDELTLHYNRARQAVITQEITEIVSGAEAL